MWLVWRVVSAGSNCLCKVVASFLWILDGFCGVQARQTFGAGALESGGSSCIVWIHVAGSSRSRIRPASWDIS